jgi:HrpA-like RNA helicase
VIEYKNNHGIMTFHNKLFTLALHTCLPEGHAEPGAGKTTRLPAALLSAVPGKILVLEPRRMAAIAAVHRIAEENN